MLHKCAGVLRRVRIVPPPCRRALVCKNLRATRNGDGRCIRLFLRWLCQKLYNGWILIAGRPSMWNRTSPLHCVQFGNPRGLRECSTGSLSVRPSSFRHRRLLGANSLSGEWCRARCQYSKGERTAQARAWWRARCSKGQFL